MRENGDLWVIWRRHSEIISVMTRSEQSPSFSVCVSQMMTQETMVWTNMPSRKEGWMERGKKKENERLIIEGGAQITHKWQSYGYGTLDNESEWCVLTHRNPSSLGCNVRSYIGQGFERWVCVCVCVCVCMWKKHLRASRSVQCHILFASCKCVPC